MRPRFARQGVVVGALAVALAVPMGPAGAVASEVGYEELPRPDLEAFIEHDASDEELRAVVEWVEHVSGVRRFAVLDHDDAYAEFARIFRRDPDLVAAVKPGDLPRSIVIEVATSANVDRVRRRLSHVRGVGVVARRPQAVELLRQEAQRVRDCAARAGVTHELFLEVLATQEQTDAVRLALELEPGVRVMRYVDNEDAYAEFREIYSRNEELVNSISAADLPASFRLRLAAPLDDTIVDRLEALPGVEEVNGLSRVCGT